MKRIAGVLVLLVLWGWSWAVWAEEPQPEASESALGESIAVTTKLSPDPSHLGDVLTYEVVVAYPRGVSVNLPAGLTFAPLHLVDVLEGEPEATGSDLRKTFTIHLQNFALEDAKIPGFSLTYVTPSGAIEVIEVAAKSIPVERLTANEAEPVRKLEDEPVSKPYPNRVAELVVLTIAGTLAVVLFLLPFILRYLGRERTVPVPPPIPPHEVAYAALDELKHSDWVETGRLQLYYLQLTEIAKAYVEGRFAVPILDRTTDEIRSDLLRRGDDLRRLPVDAFITFLDQCDLVKFARQTPSDDEACDALETVRSFVDEVERGEPESSSPPVEGDDASPPQEAK